MRGAVVIVVAMVVTLGVAAPAAARGRPSSVAAGHVVRPGAVVVSPQGRYRLLVTKTGNVVERDAHGREVWSTRTRGAAPALIVRSNGDVVLVSHRRVLWQTNTTGAGASRLRLDDDGRLTLVNRSGTVWTSAEGNRCRGSHGDHHVLVDLSEQRAVLCARHQQILVTPVTTGASALGYGTPTGTWQVYGKTRNTTLYPAAGGAYPVHYWMPYSGPYGMHDSPWQTFAYGSATYKTHGSHGCVHFPGPAMARLFAWAPVGTTVTVRG